MKNSSSVNWTRRHLLQTVPALATYLKALHNFEEDLKEALGLTSLYNQALGTRADEHLYDRVKDRDSGGRRRPWEPRVPVE